MRYILIEQDDGLVLYQCILRDVVVCYRTAAGVETVQVGGSRVIDAAPPTPAWDAPDPAPAPAPDPVPASNLISQVEYLKRFTQSERMTIRAAAKVSLEVEDYIAMLDAATEGVHLDDPVTLAGLQALEAAGLIGPGRAAEIGA